MPNRKGTIQSTMRTLKYQAALTSSDEVCIQNAHAVIFSRKHTM